MRQDVSELGVVERRQRGLSRSFQRTSVFDQMPVRKQVELASYKMGNRPAPTPTRLHELSLDHVGDTVANDLGYGEQRRLDLAIALVGTPACCCSTSRWPACR